ncbi:copper chaperone [Actinomycetospora sp. C-140]
MTPAARGRLRVRVPLLVVSGAAWLLLVVAVGGGHGGYPAPSHDGTDMAMPMAPTTGVGLSALLSGAVLMVGAMMLPLLVRPLRHVLDRSLARRRSRAVAVFLLGWGVVWIAAGAALMAAAQLVTTAAGVTTVLLAAAVWQCSPAKGRCLTRLHHHPRLAAFGPAADRDVLAFGTGHALWCVGACWAVMLLPMLAPQGQVAAMAAATCWIAAERLERPEPPHWCLRFPRRALGLTRRLRGRRSVPLVFLTQTGPGHDHTDQPTPPQHVLDREHAPDAPRAESGAP